MFRSATDHHQGVHMFLVKITELKRERLRASPHQSPRISKIFYAAASPNHHI
jgi:hypothetical protein